MKKVSRKHMNAAKHVPTISGVRGKFSLRLRIAGMSLVCTLALVGCGAATMPARERPATEPRDAALCVSAMTQMLSITQHDTLSYPLYARLQFERGTRATAAALDALGRELKGAKAPSAIYHDLLARARGFERLARSAARGGISHASYRTYDALSAAVFATLRACRSK
jgi:hypothetical protein